MARDQGRLVIWKEEEDFDFGLVFGLGRDE